MFERPLLSNIHSLLQGDSYYYPLKSTGCFLQWGRRADFFFFFFFGIFLITHGTKEDIQHYLFLGYKVYQLKQQTEKKHNYLTNLSYICMCIT